MRTKTWGVLGVCVALAAALFALPAASGNRSGDEQKDKSSSVGAVRSPNGVYIVQLIDQPVVAYEGGIAGYSATAPAKGKKIDPLSADVVKYAGYLDSKHDAALNAVGGAKKLYDYHYSYNGFAAKLTPGQAGKLESAPGVVKVSPDEVGHIETSSTPSFLGLDASDGLWNKLGGVGSAGENVIIGVVDTGVNPDHPSFSDRTGEGPNGQEGKLGYQQIPGWHGKCTPGEAFPASDCNQKLIGAQYFFDGFGKDRIAGFDYLSARDWNGHGSHTSSTAGGNNGVPATGDAAAFGKISGMAPRARIAMYKVCWETEQGDGGCDTSDSVEAIDQAVADGVDVINYSISGTLTNYLDPVEVSFLFAARAGVFVAASAGNSGPGASTVAHISPWLTSVAAGTHNRGANGSVKTGDGVTYAGQSVSPAEVTASLVYAKDVAASGASPDDARLCFPGAIDPAKVAGKIVLCDRGVNARTEKSSVVKAAGGVGMVLANTSPNSLNADLHFVPTVHVDNVAGAAIKAYITANGASAKATIAKATIVYNAPAPFVAAFSSRGPSRAGGGDILKPDVIAPGVDILAAVAPPGNFGRSFDLYSGTSMSSPHVAGLAALLHNLHPDWSPMAIKSALMTTATDLKASTSPFNQGAGHVKPNSAADPGLVYDAGWADWLSFLKGQGLCCASSASVTPIDASDLNQASIAIGDLAGSQVVKRTVTNVGSQSETYTAAVSGLAGFDVAVSPSSFSIAPGEKKSFTVTITRTTGTLNAYTFGNLTWNGDKGHAARSPLVVRPVPLAAPAALAGSGTSGSKAYGVKFGYSGSFSAAVRGLIPATTISDTVVDDPTNTFVPGGPGQKAYDVVVPAGTTYARFSLFDEFTDGEDDLDLYVYKGSTLVGSSGGGTAAEEVNLVDPAAGTYTVYVHGWQTDGPDAQFTLFHWVLGSAAAGNATVTAPATATLGGTGSVTFDWTGLAAGKKYLGSVVYSGSSGMPTTIVRIDT